MKNIYSQTLISYRLVGNLVVTVVVVMVGCGGCFFMRVNDLISCS